MKNPPKADELRMKKVASAVADVKISVIASERSERGNLTGIQPQPLNRI